MATFTPVQAIWAMAAYEYNVSPLKRAERLFPGSHPGHLAEWCDRFLRSHAEALGHMDEITLTRYVGQALESQGEHALEAVAS